MFLPLYDSNKKRYIQRPYVNYTLIAITCIVFLFTQGMGTEGLFQAQVGFGMIPVVVDQTVASPIDWLPPYATLITYMFLHANWLHLASNMLFLWVLGDNIEDAMGHFKYLIFYLACGAIAGYAHMFFNAQSYAPLVGASGAVSGVIAAYLILYPHVRVIVLNRIFITIPLPLPAWLVLGLWVITQFASLLFSQEDAVAWWAHIGGLAAGAILIIILKRRELKIFAKAE